MTKYIIPGNTQILDEVYIVISKDLNGEGIVSFITPIGSSPLVFSDPAMLPKVRELTEMMAQDSGQTLQICKFKKLEVINQYMAKIRDGVH